MDIRVKAGLKTVLFVVLSLVGGALGYFVSSLMTEIQVMYAIGSTIAVVIIYNLYKIFLAVEQGTRAVNCKDTDPK